jgi:oligosaccharide translocation protein RFT1
MRSAMGEVLTGVRVRAEGVGITSKTVTTCLVLLYDSRRTHPGEFALLAFAAGQLAYGVFLFATYLSHFRGVSQWPIAIASTCVNVFPASSCVIINGMSSENASE